MTKIQQVLTSAVIRMLRPLVRILLRHNVTFKAFSDIAKWVYVDEAKKSTGIPGKKVSNSRIAIVTGISRIEVQKNLEHVPPQDDSALAQSNRAARVLSGWVREPFYAEPSTGKPMDIPIEGPAPSFQDLVHKYSGGMPVRAVLDEVLRIESVRRLEDGLLRLVSCGYVPDSDERSKIPILGSDVADLLKTMDHNLRHGVEQSRVQLTVACDNLPEEVMARLRSLSKEKAQALVKEMEQWLASFDRDQNDKIFGTGRKRAGLGVYFFEEDHAQEDSHE